jgi:hypothetical protein
VWSWLGIGSGIAVVLAIAGLRVAQDHARPQPFAAASLPSVRPEARFAIAPARAYRKPRK